MERTCVVSAIVVAICLSFALSACPPASCPCERSDLALCLTSTNAANCSVLCLQGDYTTSQPVVVTRNLSVIADGSAVVTCNGDEGFLIVKDADFLELKGLVVNSCSRAIVVNNVTQVRITISTFRNATGPFAVSIVDCFDVTIDGCSFFYSGSTGAEGVTKDAFTGTEQPGGSGLSVNLSRQVSISAAIVICNCSFTGRENSSEGDRGRGLLVSMAAGTTNATLSVEDCSFVNNFAAAYGGGVYVEVGDNSSGCNIGLRSNLFEGNQAEGGGGVGILMYSGSRFSSDVNHLVLYNNTFLDNEADFAGGAFISVAYNGIAGTRILVDKCTFVNNTVSNFTGGALYISSLSSFLVRNRYGGTETSIQPEIRDITCEANTAGSGGSITLINYPALFTGRNVLSNNIGPAVRAISTVIGLDGEMYLLDNRAESTAGGALYLSNAQVRVFNGSAMVFESNRGSLGASIVSEPVYTNPLFTHLPFNPLCFFLYHNKRTLVNDWKADIVFASNRAQTGSAVYADQLGECAHYGGTGTELLFNASTMLSFEPPFLYSDNTNSRHNDSANLRWQISTPAASFTLKCETENGTMDDCDKVVAFPGQLLTLHITPLDDIGDPTYGLVNLVEIRGREDNDAVKFSPPLQTIFPDDPRYQFRYHVHPNMLAQSVGVSVQLFSAIASEVEPRQNFTMNIAGCPVGNVLMQAEGVEEYQTCKCALGVDSAILQCNLDRESLVLKSGLWGTAEHGPLLTIRCPSGYCSCNYTIDTDVMSDNTTTAVCSSVLKLQQPDAQCACSRQGYLCGACRSGMSVTAVLNTCQSCDNTWVIGIVVLTLVDAIVIVAIALLPMFVPRFHFPSAMYSFTFYIQLAPYATANYPVSYGSFHQGLRFFGSLLGLYYPFDACLFDGATALDAFALRYIPFLLAAVITPLAIALIWWLSHRSTSITIGHYSTDIKVNYNGLWFVWMLILNDVLATSFAVLDRPSNNTQVWYYDGTVSYFTGGHAALALWAIVVMATLILAIVYILLVMYCSRQLKFARVVRKIRETVVIGFCEEYPFWFAVDFVKRFVFIAVIMYEKDSETIAIFVIALYFCLYAYLKPYKVFTDNIFELLLLGNLLALMTLRSIVYVRDVLKDLVVSPDPSDCSGWSIAKPSDFAIVLGTLYYLPVFYTALPITVSILKHHSDRLKRLVKKDRRRSGHELMKRRSASGSAAKYTVATLSTPAIARRTKAGLLDDSEDGKTERLLMSSTVGSDSLPSLD